MKVKRLVLMLVIFVTPIFVVGCGTGLQFPWQNGGMFGGPVSHYLAIPQGSMRKSKAGTAPIVGLAPTPKKLDIKNAS